MQNKNENFTAAEITVEQPKTISGVEAAVGQPKRAVSGKDIAEVICSAVCLTAQVLILVMFLFGAINLFGKGVMIWSPVNYLLKVFGINSATAFEGILSLILGVIYLIMVIAIIKHTMPSLRLFIKDCKYVFGKKDENRLSVPPVKEIYSSCISTLYLLFTFAVFANLVYSGSQPGAFTACMVLGGIAVVANFVASGFKANGKEEVLNVILSAIKQLLTYVAVCVIVALLKQCAVKDFIDRFALLTNGGIFTGAGGKAVCYSLYVNLVTPVLFFIMAIQALSMFRDDVLTSHSGVKFLSRAIYVAVFMALNFVFRTVLGAGSASVGMNMLSDWFSFNSRELFPILLMYVLLYVLEKADKTTK